MSTISFTAAQTFPRWALSTMQKLRKAVGIGSILAAAFAFGSLKPFSLIGLSSDDLNIELEKVASQRAVLFFVQAAACLLLAFLTPRPGVAKLRRLDGWTEEREYVAGRACQRIYYNLVTVFMLWCCYYVIAGIGLVIGAGGIDQAVRLSLSALTGLVIFWLYVEMAEVTVEPADLRAPATGGITRGSRNDAAFQRLISVCMLFVILVLIWYAFGKRSSGLTTLLEVIVGCLSGVALCLVVGRFSSKYIDPGPVTLGLLYFYGVIQPAASLFPEDPKVYLVATSVALPLKVLMWLTCVWAFTSGVMAEYVWEVRALIERRSVATK